MKKLTIIIFCSLAAILVVIAIIITRKLSDSNKEPESESSAISARKAILEKIESEVNEFEKKKR